MNTTHPYRIKARFETLATQGQAALVTFITAGDPSAEATLAYLQALVRGGADILELGVPFSDPMADGPTIQRASERALDGGMSLQKVLALVAAFRVTDQRTPVVLMGYLNPIERMGYHTFATAAAKAGVDGVLVVDLPPEEAAEFHLEMLAAGLAQIFLLAPTSSAARFAAVCRQATGFVYYVSVKGVTGDKPVDVAEVTSRVAAIKSVTSLPVGVGFGVRTRATAAAIAQAADAVIVGSALVEIIEQASSELAATSALEGFVRSLKDAMTGARSAMGAS